MSSSASCGAAAGLGDAEAGRHHHEQRLGLVERDLALEVVGVRLRSCRRTAGSPRGRSSSDDHGDLQREARLARALERVRRGRPAHGLRDLRRVREEGVLGEQDVGSPGRRLRAPRRDTRATASRHAVTSTRRIGARTLQPGREAIARMRRHVALHLEHDLGVAPERDRAGSPRQRARRRTRSTRPRKRRDPPPRQRLPPEREQVAEAVLAAGGHLDDAGGLTRAERVAAAAAADVRARRACAAARRRCPARR